jgi:hypothetical protein
MQPTPDGRRLADRRRLANQDEEGGLESVLCVGVIAENAAANIQDHWTVPAEQHSEGRLVSMVTELPEQMLVG